MEFITAIVLGIVEGVTEFLPISSTGHLIIVNQWLSFTPQFTATFDVVIQLGAILAVVVFFWPKLWSFNLWKKVAVAVLPVLVIGALAGKAIQQALFNPIVVACALIIGGLVMLWIEKRVERRQKTKMAEETTPATGLVTLSTVSYKTAIIIGLVQCLALIPGTSRSMVTIVAALLLGMTRPQAAEFSFFLALPTMLAATGYSFLKDHAAISSHELVLLAIGFVAAFLAAWAVIRIFMKYIETHNFKVFGYYRIVLGILVLWFLLM